MERYTYFTKERGEQLLYQAEVWVKLILVLETEGKTVTVTFRTKSRTKEFSRRFEFKPGRKNMIAYNLGKGDRAFIESDGVSKILVAVAPAPYVGQFLDAIRRKL